MSGDQVVAWLVLLLLVLAAVALTKSIRWIPVGDVEVVERRGERRVLDGGLHLVVPYLDRPVRRIGVREMTSRDPEVPVVTADGDVVLLDASWLWQVTEPLRFVDAPAEPERSFIGRSVGAARELLQDMTTDQALTSRAQLNQRLRQSAAETAAAWGIQVNRVEINEMTATTPRIG